MESEQKRIWVSTYDEQVPGYLKYPCISIPDLLDKQADLHPDQIALIFESQKLTYSQVRELSKEFSENLLKTGFSNGDHLGICLENTPEFVISFFGCLYAGGVVCALNPAFPVLELVQQIRLARINFLVAGDNLIRELRNIENLRNQLPLISISENGEMTSLVSGESHSSNHYAKGRVTAKKFEKVDPKVPAVLQFSGGTTGKPKAAIGSHLNIVSNVLQFRTWLHTLKEGKETFLVSIPLYHVYGMVLGLNLGVALGATLVLTRNARDIDRIVDALSRYPISYFPGVPSLFNAINHHPQVENGSISLQKIKACISGSAPLAESIKSEFEEKTGGKLVEGYGLSEAPTATHCNPLLGVNKTGSIGLPLPDVDCRIIDIETGTREVDQGGVGELWIKGPQVMKGYFEDPEETEVVLRDGWLRTGDAAYMDEEGYFYLIGRIKELIKVHGLQVWPGEVEEVLRQIPGVIEVAVAGIPDAAMGERVKAWFVMEAGKNISLDLLRSFCAPRLGAYKIPVELSVCDALPRSPVGKVLRRKLIEPG